MPQSPHNEKAGKNLNWRGNAPVSDKFGDVYYSAEDGLEETRFVFLKGTGFPEACENGRDFVIAETGFGTGLNFLASWKAWTNSGAKGTLTFISVEGYPLTERALEEAHETFPEVADYAAELRKAWPAPAPGFHPRHFAEGKVRLILLFGDAAASFARLRAKVDAWYLDGFAPSKNPEMWSDALIEQIARLSKPGTRFATFTAAGFVRRALQERGFHVEKTPGYGRKRERLEGTFETQAAVATSEKNVPEWASLASTPTGRIAVIGMGIAGASIANALKRRGRDIVIIGGHGMPTASQVPAAILSPRFMLERNATSEFFTSAYTYSCWLPDYQKAWAPERGVTVLPKNENDSVRLNTVQELLDWDETWLAGAAESFHLCRGGSISSETALSHLIADIPRHEGVVTRLERNGGCWTLTLDTDETIEAEAVVLATGIGTPSLLGDIGCPELRPNRGQIEQILPPYPDNLPSPSLAYGGYVTAEVDGSRTIGSTFDRLSNIDESSFQTSDSDSARIIEQFEAITGLSRKDLTTGNSWAGVRATTPDHLPYAGPVANYSSAQERYASLAQDAKTRNLGKPDLVPGLYLLAGLGSKGYQYGPILGEYLAAQICDEPLPLPTDLIAPLHPLRDLIRSIKRS